MGSRTDAAPSTPGTDRHRTRPRSPAEKKPCPSTFPLACAERSQARLRAYLKPSTSVALPQRRLSQLQRQRLRARYHPMDASIVGYLG